MKSVSEYFDLSDSIGNSILTSCVSFIDNLDEMLHQFSGREEDLVTTLRTMQSYRDESANAGVFEEDSSVATND
jgi:hypothetical protein